MAVTHKELKDYYINGILDIIDDIYLFDYDEDIVRMESELDDVEDRVREHIFELIDGSCYVIYTYQAKEVIELLNYFTAFDIGDITGERFDSYSQCAYENIYMFISEEIDPDHLLDNFIKVSGNRTKMKKENA